MPVRNNNLKYDNKEIVKICILFVSFLCIFIPLYIKFYTGNVLTSLLLSLGSNSESSNYQNYQEYFSENGLNEFSISKLPYILGFGISKLLYYYFVFCFICYGQKITFFKKILLGLMMGLFLMVGISRGTNFESFEFLVLLLFSFLVRAKIVNNANFFPRKQLLVFGALVILALFSYVFTIQLRGSDPFETAGGPTATLAFDKNHWALQIMPSIAMFARALSGYFTFGLYFASEVFWKVWIDSFSGILSSVFPYGGGLLLGLHTYREGVEAAGVDCGACWDPDTMVFIYYLGLPLYYVLIYNLGRLTGYAYNQCVVNKDAGYCLALYLLIYQMISFPVGNFLTVSSANKMMMVLVFGIIYFNMFKKYRMR